MPHTSGLQRLGGLVAAAAVATGSMSMVVLSAPSASAAAPDGCVTRHEFRQVEKGDTPREVKRTFGTRGELGNGGAGGFDRLYPQCTSAFMRTAQRGDGCQVKVEFVVRGSSGTPRVADKKFDGVCSGGSPG